MEKPDFRRLGMMRTIAGRRTRGVDGGLWNSVLPVRRRVPSFELMGGACATKNPALSVMAGFDGGLPSLLSGQTAVAVAGAAAPELPTAQRQQRFAACPPESFSTPHDGQSVEVGG